MKTQPTLKTALTCLLLMGLASRTPAAIDDANTALTVQGQLFVPGTPPPFPPPHHPYITFTLFNASSGGTPVAGPVTNMNVEVDTNTGVFTTFANFGSNVDNTHSYWMEISVGTNAGGPFTTLSPRQSVTPAPQAYYAGTAGVAAVAMMATNFAGMVSGDVSGSQGATVVASVGGQTAANIASATVAANSATSAANAGTLVTRDGAGSFSAGSVTLNGALNLPFPAIIYAGSNTCFVEEGSLFIGGIYGPGYQVAGYHAGANDHDVGIGDSSLSSSSTGTFNTAIGEQSLLSDTTGSDNTAGGFASLRNNTTGSFNKADGYEALYSNTTGNNNTGNGALALFSNTTGNYNTGNGFGALELNVSGSGNSANGDGALYANTTGSSNTANGLVAMKLNTTGSQNTANGANALFNNNASDNTANGFSALYANTSGVNNTGDGAYALNLNTTGNYNTADGFAALQNNNTGTGNNAMGDDALFANTTGSSNTVNGFVAMKFNNTGSYNTANGAMALFNNNANNNTANGFSTLYENSGGTNNTADGANALYNNTVGGNNVADGSKALFNNTVGGNNIAIGNLAGQNLTTGSFDIDIGNQGVAGESDIIRIGTEGTQTGAYMAGIWGTTLALSNQFVVVDSTGHLGVTNVAASSGGVTMYYGGHVTVSPSGVPATTFTLGSDATPGDLFNTIVSRDSTGSFNANNIALGNADNCTFQNGVLNLPTTANFAGIITLGGCTNLFIHGYGNDNFFGGLNAGNLSLSGSNNVGVGAAALISLTSGTDNTGVGDNALFNNLSGTGNSGVGGQSLYNNQFGSFNTADGVASLDHSTANNNIGVGYLAGDGLATGTQDIYIGNQGEGENFDPAESQTIRIGVSDLSYTNNPPTNTYIAGIYSATVSGGVPVFVDSDGHLGTLTSSARFKQNIKSMKDASDVLLALRPVTYQYKPGIDPKANPQFGLVAEEVEKVDPDLVVHDERHGIYTVRYEAVNAMLLNEFLKQHQKVEDQNSEIESLKEKAAQVDSLASRVDELQSLVKQIAAQK